MVSLNTTHTRETNEIPAPPSVLAGSPLARWSFFAIAWFMVVLGIVGIVVPGLPTTVFLIAAVWAFSRSSARFQIWLWEHNVLGPSVRAWHQYRVIPIRGKVLAVVMMSASVLYMAHINPGNVMPPMLLGGVLFPIGIYICTRSGKPPIEDTASMGEP